MGIIDTFICLTSASSAFKKNSLLSHIAAVGVGGIWDCYRGKQLSERTPEKCGNRKVKGAHAVILLSYEELRLPQDTT